jgi:hypothetical protein
MPDQTVLDTIRNDYPTEQKAGVLDTIRNEYGESPKEEKAPSSIARRALGDTGISLAKGIVGVPETAVGLADLVTGGHAGKLAKDAGVDFARTKQILDSGYSPEQQEANAKVQQAEGFLPTLKAVAENPSTAVQTIAESAPSMLGGQAIAKQVLKNAPKIAPLVAGAIGEGAVTAGQNAEQVRQQTPDQLLTPKQALLTAGSGALTGGITHGFGKIANKLGVGDVNTAFLGRPAAAAGKSLPRRVGEEGLIEAGQETLQSGQEQAATNLALDKPVMEGVGNAAAIGAVAGAGMGGGMAAVTPTVVQVPAPEAQAPVTEAQAPVTEAQAPVTEAQAPAPEAPDPMQAKPFVDHFVNAGVAPNTYSKGFSTALNAAGIVIDPAKPPAEAFAELQAAVYAQPKARVEAVTADLTETLDAHIAANPTGSTVSKAVKAAVVAGTTEPQIAAAKERPITRTDGTPYSTAGEANNFLSRMMNGKPSSEHTTVKLPEGGFGIIHNNQIDDYELPDAKDTETATPTGPTTSGTSAAAPGSDQVIDQSQDPATQEGAAETARKVVAGIDSSVAANGVMGTVPAALRKSAQDLGVYDSSRTPEQMLAAVRTHTEAPIDEAIAREHPLSDANTYQVAGKPEDTKKAAVNFQDLHIAIENPVGSVRSGTSPEGEKWETTMQDHYGEIKAGEGADGDAVDTFIPAGLTRAQIDSTQNAYVIDQVDPKTGLFDEVKVILGVASPEEAKAVYSRNYAPDWKGFGAITAMPMADFKTWVHSDAAKLPAAKTEARKQDRRQNTDISFIPPSERRVNERRNLAKEHGVTDQSALEQIVPQEKKHFITGFEQATEKDPIILEALEIVEETGTTAHFVEADIANLGGMNAFFGDNHAIVNPYIKQLGDIFANALRQVGTHEVFIHHGGDEISAVILGGTDARIKEAMNSAREKSLAWAKEQGLDTIPHLKTGPGKVPGTGLYVGFSPMVPGMTLADISARAAAELNAGKTGVEYVEGNTGSENNKGVQREDSNIGDSPSETPSSEGQAATTELKRPRLLKEWVTGEPAAIEVKTRKSPSKTVKSSDHLLTVIAKVGGLSRESAKRQGIDPAAFGTPSGSHFSVFPAKGGKTFDEIAGLLDGVHFDLNGQEGTYDPNVLLELLDNALRGDKIYTAEGYAGIEKLASAERFDEEEAKFAFDLQNLHNQTAEYDPEQLPSLEYIMAQGGITPLNINEFWDELNDNIGSKSEGNIAEDVGEDQGELDSYDQTDLDAREREQKQRAKDLAARELAAKNKAESDSSVDSLYDEMFTDKGRTDDLFGEPMFSLPENSLAITHNLSLVNLMHADKMGGIAVPSVAVTNSNHTMGNFGEITLVGDKDQLGPEASSKNRYFNADIYSPRYPNVTSFPDRKKIDSLEKSFSERVKALQKQLGYNGVIDVDDGVVKGLGHNLAVQYHYLENKGKAPALTYVKSNEIDISELGKKVRSKLNQQEFEYWLRTEHANLVSSEKIFDGFTYSGNRKYLPHNLDTVVKILTKKVQGGENFSYGVPSIRAHAAKQFKTVKAMQQDRDSIVSEAEMDTLKEEVNQDFSEIESELNEYSKFERPQAAEALAGFAEKGIREFNEYYEGVPVETMAKIAEFLGKLRNMPTHYFEGKIGRSVDIGEFSGAIVPKGKEYEPAIELLKRKGITKIARYDRNGDRSAALKSFKDLLFSISNEAKGDLFASIEEAQTHAEDLFGKGVSRLPLNFTHGQESWPEVARHPNAEGVYYQGNIWVDLNNTTKERMKSVLLHEIGEHFGLEKMIGTQVYESLQAQIKNRAERTGSLENRVWNDVARLYPHVKVGSKQFVAEVIAKLGEKNQPWYRRLITQIKAFLMRHGIARGFVNGTFTGDDMHQLLVSSLKSAAGRATEPMFIGGEAMASTEQAPRFYSALRNMFIASPEKVFGNPAQVKAWLLGNAAKYDVKKDEIYWSGILNLLDMQEGKVTKTDMVNFNGVQVEDVVSGNPHAEWDKAKASRETGLAEFDKNIRALREEEHRQIMVLGEPDSLTPEAIAVWKEGHTAIVSEMARLKEEKEKFSQEGLLKMGAALNIPESRHGGGNLELPGGVDYKELIVTIPTTEAYNESDETHFGREGKGKQIAWIRHNTRTDIDGNKTLFLEEVQSQRSQAGRTEGFINIPKALPDNWIIQKRGARFYPVNKNELDANGEYATLLGEYGTVADYSLEGATKKAIKALRTGTVPPAPFVTDSNNKSTNAYITLLLKKAVSSAIDGGHDSVTWTTGDQQADRYSLAKQIDRIEYEEVLDPKTYVPTGTFDLSVFNLDGQNVHEAYAQTPKQIEELVGKDAVNKILNGEGKVSDGAVGWEAEDSEGLSHRVLSGLDLSVKPQWVSAMYGDGNGMNAQGKPSLILQAAGDIARKMGGKIGSQELLTGEDWTTQPALIITPEMKAKIQSEGMPLFSTNKEKQRLAPNGKPSNLNAGQQAQVRTPEFKAWFGDSKAIDENDEPKVYYHGSTADIKLFMRGAGGYAYFTDSHEYASKYAGNSEGSQVYPVYLAVKNPLDLTHFGEKSLSDKEFRDFLGSKNVSLPEDAQGYPETTAWRHIKGEEVKWAAMDAGYDGIIVKEGDGKTAVAVFESTQAKSAIGNNGAFSPEDNDIRHSIREPWQKSAAEYNAPAELKPQESFYVGKVEVIRNPSNADQSDMRKEAAKEYGVPGNGDPILRFTQDADGNRYVWKAYEAVHPWIEPAIEQREGVHVDQNAAQKLSHRGVVRRALYEGQPVPSSVIAEYPGLLEEVSEIPGNQAPMHSFAGEKSKIANLENLTSAKAKLDNGENPEQVRKETGWFKGTVDGKWRFEIDDSKFKLKENAWGKDLEEIDGVPGRKLIGNLGDRWHKLGAITAERLGKKETFQEGLVTDTDLFKAYPDLANVQVTLRESNAFLHSENGHYSPGKNEIYMEINPSLGGDAKGSLLHEIQHVIQFKEKFALGGNAEEFNHDLIMRERNDEFKRQTYEELPALLAAYRAESDPVKKSEIFNRRMALMDEIAANKKLTPYDWAFEKYKRLAGEVEARNTQTRNDYSEEQRRNTPPSETQDRADHLQTIDSGNGGSMHSIRNARDQALANADTTLGRIKSNRWVFLSVQQMAERTHKYLPQIKNYVKAMKARRVVVEDWYRQSDRITSVWQKLKDKVAVSNLMQDSTLPDVDASQAWSGVTKEKGLFRVHSQAKFTATSKAKLTLGMGYQNSVTTGDFYKQAYFLDRVDADVFLNMLNNEEAIQTRLGHKPENGTRKTALPKLQAKYAALTAEAQGVYKDSNETLNALANARLHAIEMQIERAIDDGRIRSQMISELRKNMEAGSLEWYYTPLQRFGDYWFYGKNSAGQPVFSSFDSLKKMKAAEAVFRADGGKNIKSGKKMQSIHDDLAATDAFMLDVRDKIHENVSDDAEARALQDAIYQMYLQSLPDVSARHSAQHRKGVLGFDKDAIRSFTFHIHHGASQLGNMTEGRNMAEAAKAMRDTVTMAMDDEYDAAGNITGNFRRREAEIQVEAAEMLQDDWATLTAPGHLEAEQAADPDNAIWKEALTLRRKFGHLPEVDAYDALERFSVKLNTTIDHSRMLKDQKLQIAAGEVADEIKKSFDAMVNTQSSDLDKIASDIRQASFIWMLGYGVSTGLMNLLQTPIVAMPVVASKFGFGKTVSAFNKTYGEFMAAIKLAKRNDPDSVDEDGNASISVVLERRLRTLTRGTAAYKETESDVKFMQYIKSQGETARTQMQDVIGLSQRGDIEGGKLQEINKSMGWMFHHGERVNREVTLLAAYRLMRDSKVSDGRGGMRDSTLEEAQQYAEKATHIGHGDYNAENAARIFRGWPAGIALQFGKYPHLMYYAWGSAFQDTFNGWKKMPAGAERDAVMAEAKEAGSRLIGLAITQFTVAGAFGMPLMGATVMLLNMIGAALTDDDDPWDTKKEARMWLFDLGGEEFATAMTKGFFNAVTPADLGGRLGIADIKFREGKQELEGRDQATQLLVSLFGPTGGLMQKVFEGAKLAGEGEFERAAEQLLPKALGDPLKSARFAAAGATSIREGTKGDKLKDMSPGEVFLQIFGIGSSDLANKYDDRGYAFADKKHIEEARTVLLHRIANAKTEHEEIPSEEWREWNVKYPLKPILPTDVANSIAASKREEKKRGSKGYYVPDYVPDYSTSEDDE